MRLSRALRAIVALTAAAFLLLCQTAFAAKLCGQVFNAKQASSSAPCHERGGINDGPVMPSAPSACDAAQAFTGTVTVPILSIAYLPVMAVMPIETASPKTAPVATHALFSACHPPPLTILHGCLRN